MFNITRLNQVRHQVWIWVSRHGAAVIVFTIVFMLVTWPWVMTPGLSILGSAIGDGWKTVEQFWWYEQALIEKKISPFHNPNIFYPEGWNTVTSSHSSTLMFPTVPFTFLWGPFGAYFLLMLAGFVFAGLGTYFLLYCLTQDRLAGILGGVSFAFCMSRLLHVGGHFNVVVGSAWIPWVFVFLEMARQIENGRRRIGWSIAAGISYAGAMLSYWYFVYIIAIPLVAYFYFDLWQALHDRKQYRQALGRSILTFATAGILATPFALLTMQARAVVGVTPHRIEATAQLVASLDRFLMPNRYHPIWGSWFQGHFPDRGEQSFIFLGLIATTLALIAIFRRVHTRAAIYGVLVLVSMVMAMGPHLYWSNVPITLSLPWTDRATSIPLPGILFFQYAPLFNTIRVWARFSLVTSFAIATLAGLTVAYLHSRSTWGGGICMALIALVIVESFGHPFVVVPATAMEREVDRWLASQPEQFAIMELPLNARLRGNLHYSQILHGKQLAAGYTAAMPSFFLEAVPHFTTFPNQITVDILQQWGVRYLLYTVSDPVAFQANVAPAIEELPGLTHVATFDGHPEPYIHIHLGKQVYVYLVDDQNP